MDLSPTPHRNPFHHVVTASRVSAGFAGILTLCGCAGLHPNPIPGHDASITKPDLDGVPVSKVLTVVKRQVALALEQVNALRKNYPNSAISDTIIHAGEGSLVATVETATSSEGGLSAVIPFSGYKTADASTEAKPGIEAGVVASSLREETFEFSIETKVPLASASAKDVVADEVINRAIVAKYHDMLEVADNSSGPEFGPSKLILKFGFTVERAASGEAEITFLPPQTFTEAGASFGGGRKGTYTHELELSFSFVAEETGDPRELIYSVSGPGGQIYLKEPYSEARYKELLSQIGGQGVRIAPQGEPKPFPNRDREGEIPERVEPPDRGAPFLKPLKAPSPF